MREFHVRISAEHQKAVTSILDKHEVDYATITEDGESHLFFPLPTAAVSAVLRDLETADVANDSYTVMTKAEFTQTPNFTDLQDDYSTNIKQLSKRELHAKIQEIQWPYQLYYLGTILSVIAATAGLLLDQPALVIGSMVIAPQASSALAGPAGVLLSDWELFTDSIREQTLGLGAAIIGATVFAFLVRWGGFVPPSLSITQVELIGLRLSPTLLSTIGALAAGIVGAFAYTTEQSTALVGVMIAAALIPAAAAVGLAIAWAAPLFGAGAFLLLLVNTLAINLGGFVTLVGMGYQPTWRSSNDSLRDSIAPGNRLAVYGTLFMILVVTLGAGYLTGANIVFSHQVSQEVETTIDQPGYENLSVSGVQSAYGGVSLGAEPINVTVSMSRSTNQSYPNLTPRLERHIQQRADRDVQVIVEFTESQSSDVPLLG